MEKHFTATIYLVAVVNGDVKVLLHKHKKMAIWIGVGGHVERDENPFETVLRETKEETGFTPTLIPRLRQPFIASYVTLLPTPHFIFQFKISAYRNEPSHFHIDLVFIGTIKRPSEIKMQEEFRWFSAKELKTLELQKEVVYITRKALEIGKRYI